MQTLMRDHRMRESARIIQKEVSMLVEDVRRLSERAGKLAIHFDQARKDIDDVGTSADKIVRRGARLKDMDFEEQATLPGTAQTARLRAVE
ncbi:MAG: DNA recombination protein RmuC, partial [Beijerinckiaceae bacterium]